MTTKTELENSFKPSMLLLAVEPSELRAVDNPFLHQEVLTGNLEFINEILAPNNPFSINPNEQNENNHTPLHLAALYGKYQAAKVLLERGASTDIRDKEGKTALHLAAEMNEHEVLKLLFEHGAAVNETNGSGKTALHVAARAGRLESVKCLLQHDAEMTRTDLLGNNVLHAAASCSVNHAIIQLLIQNGMDVQAMNQVKETPLQLATHLKYQGNIALLKSY